ncbi:hypothetical protein [Azospirillum halopraeferens]|uniref:hypothetical protein n=1 Tax=Azospirillum halopraeferens TaxID=34010 RepID=UPI0012EC821B|nr:hypothetical protein [Azospirillum halopraeferens]
MSGRELPAGWVETTIGEVTRPYRTVDPTHDPEATFRYIDIGAIDNVTHTISSIKIFSGKNAPSRARRVVARGDVLYSTVRPYLKNIAEVPAEFDGSLTSTGIAVLRPSAGILSNYLRLWVLTEEFAKSIGSSMDGSLYPAVRDSDVEAAPVALPPLAEQRRIVEKIEALTARSRRAREALGALPALIDRYRQSILAAAFRGDLTAKDQGNDGRDLEPGEGPYPIPHEWKWAAMQDLVSSGPQNGLYLPKSKYGAGHPILRIDNFQDYSSSAAVEFKKVELSSSEREVYGLSVNDIVINRVNAPSHLGKCMVVSERHVPAVFESNMMRLRVKGDVPARYVAYFLKSPAGRKALLSNAKWAVNQASINQGDVLATPVPLPVHSGEMQEIVDCIESALAKIEAFGAGVESMFDRLSTLDQSILAKAFRGELVPQDPNDEPASVLLERIRAERAAAGEKPRRGRPRRAG